MFNLVRSVAIVLAGVLSLDACTGGPGGPPGPPPPPTHHGVIYGIVKDQGGNPVEGVAIGLVMNSEPGCFGPYDLATAEQTDSTGSDGAYRVFFEIALPEQGPYCVNLTVGASDPHAPGFALDTIGFGGPITAQLDSVRHDLVLR